jgi:hypothetical protein
VIWFLRIAFSVVLLTMLCVTTWASGVEAIWKIPPQVTSDPWFIATLFDTYFAFLTFYCWVAYKEMTWLSRALWLVAILLLGNIAMASYMLIQLFRIPADSPIERLLLRRK